MENNKAKKSKEIFIYTEEDFRPAYEEEYEPNDFESQSLDSWSIQSIWNEEVSELMRAPKERDYISFSDIGKKDYWSRYMKMTGVETTNKPSPRLMRIFQAGNEFHNLVKNVFKKAGIFINSQDELDRYGNIQYTEIPATETTLKQYGMYDILVGGKPDLDKALRWIEESDLSFFAKEKAEKIARLAQEKFKDGLKKYLYEVKSINSNAFWSKKQYLYDAYSHHRHQAYGYLMGNREKEGVEEARLLYISKDDLTLAEFPILLNDIKLRESYKEDVERMSYYILNKIEPPKPPYVIYDPHKKYSFQHNKIKHTVRGCYTHNWEVGWSPYLTLMTGFKNEDEFIRSKEVRESISERNIQIKQMGLSKGVIS